MVEVIEQWVLALADQAWVYPLTSLLVVLDGIFPPVPSEAVLAALAALWQTTGTPGLGGLFLAGVIGAWLGDQLAYQVGRWIGVERFLRGPRSTAAIEWARRSLESHGPSFLIVSRYIPVLRVAATMAAGSVGYSRKTYSAVTAVSSVIWTIYMLATGLIAGMWLQENPMAAMVLGIVVGIVIGLLVERVSRLILRRRERAV